MIWRLRSTSLNLDRPLLMGVLNLTPDSFSDGGRHADRDAALRRAEQIASEGADLLDIGAESTRPGADPVEPAEEWRRLEPVLRAL
ncbi:MAG TPA: dihydropteroate synthase, partial [bacterium]|nr:dihydropteroate synthase [bacterium]